LKFKKKKIENPKSDKKPIPNHNDGRPIESVPENIVSSIKPPSGSGKKLGSIFYDSPAVELAKNLLGKVICRMLEDGIVLRGRIVETEGYLGETDKACHSYGGKRTSRTEPMFMSPGTAYVYFIYGMHFCLNISSKDRGGAVLIRALEPVEGD
jgi:DNA-3-methyladenine glycosylase